MFKNLLIIVVAAAVYLHFYPNEDVNKWVAEQKENADELFNETFDTKARVSPKKLLSAMQKDMQKFTKAEVAYLETLVESRSDLKEFNKTYCGTTKRNPQMRDIQVDQVCEKISQQRIF